jgi:hypothetical protein
VLSRTTHCPFRSETAVVIFSHLAKCKLKTPFALEAKALSSIENSHTIYSVANLKTASNLLPWQ